MDQLESSNSNKETSGVVKSSARVDNVNLVEIPNRTFTTEFFVGLFAVITLCAGGWLAVGLGGINIMTPNSYIVKAEFDNISGLKKGASVEIAGVQIGEVIGLELLDPQAVIIMQIRNNIPIHEDDIAAIRTKGIIGDRYVKISRGASENIISPGGVMLETEAVVDFEDIIGKLIHSFSPDDS